MLAASAEPFAPVTRRPDKPEPVVRHLIYPTAPMLSKLLSADQDELLKEERRVLDATPTCAREVRRRARTSVRPRPARSSSSTSSSSWSSSASSTPARARSSTRSLGSRVVEEGVTPDDRADQRPSVRRHDGAAGPRAPHLHVITAPVPLLRDIHIVDTPGTNAIIREHERITAEFVPRSDLVLFVTSADRPFTETERAFLEQIRGWGKKVVVVINKIDILEGDEQVARGRRVRRATARTRCSGFDPDIFPVSAQAGAARQGGRPGASGRRAASRRSSATSQTTLDAPGRVQLKLLNPLGVAASRRRTARGAASRERLALLKEDFATLDDVERQLADVPGGPGARPRAADGGHRPHPPARWSGAATTSSTTRCGSAA